MLGFHATDADLEASADLEDDYWPSEND